MFFTFQVKGRNVLLIDHPVGTGFSYADNDTLLVNSDRDMGKLTLWSPAAYYVRPVISLTIR